MKNQIFHFSIKNVIAEKNFKILLQEKYNINRKN